MVSTIQLPRRPKEKSGARTFKAVDRPSRAEAEDAVRTLIRWAGDNPDREGLTGTPARVVRAGECRRMACDTPDLESKAAWDRLADRWVRCAELEEARPAPERRPPKYRHAERSIYWDAS